LEYNRSLWLAVSLGTFNHLMAPGQSVPQSQQVNHCVIMIIMMIFSTDFISNVFSTSTALAPSFCQE